jgi:putative acyl-CoA dehydrogenase
MEIATDTAAPQFVGGTTHRVTNQPRPLQDYDVYEADRPLYEAVEREGAGWAHAELHALGASAGSPEAIGWGFEADIHPPRLLSHDRFGHRIDEVTFHPSYHRLLGAAVGHGLNGAAWADPRPGSHVARAAGLLLWTQVDAGVTCPSSMTYAAVPVLRGQPELACDWVPALTSRRYDPRLCPVGDKQGALVGMSMTEKQGGSDVRANTTTARPMAAGGPGQAYRLTGHKWFCSAPMSDAFLVLAQAGDGLSCLLLPRVLPDGVRNVIRLQRLKDKLGNRSNASAEIELDGALGWLIGDEGRGVRTIVEMVALTRLDCVLGTAGLMRQAVAQAIHHATQRHAFGRALLDQPLMRVVLADLAVESEAATVLALRLAGAVDRCAHDRDPDGSEALLLRLGTAVAKYWVCKRGPAVAAEALECLGGNGYVEESVLPRLYREAPVNSVWEGSGNINALDVLRALDRSGRAAAILLAELDQAAGGDARLDRFVAGLRADLTADQPESGARRLVERMALALQGALLVRHAPTAVADAFCASRLDGAGGLSFGTLPGGADLDAILDRHRPLPG